MLRTDTKNKVQYVIVYEVQKFVFSTNNTTLTPYILSQYFTLKAINYTHHPIVVNILLITVKSL